jgi:hypothetical protein
MRSAESGVLWPTLSQTKGQNQEIKLWRLWDVSGGSMQMVEIDAAQENRACKKCHGN